MDKSIGGTNASQGTDPGDTRNGSKGHAEGMEDTKAKNTAAKDTATKPDFHLRTTDADRKQGDVMWSSSNLATGFNEVFSKTSFLFILLFVIVYYIAYVIIHRLNGSAEAGEDGGGGTQKTISRTVDFIIIALVLLLCVYYFANISSAVDTDVVRNVLVWTRDFFDNPANLVSLPLSIVVFYSLIYLCQIPMTAGVKPYTISFLENKFWLLLIILIILLVFKYALGFSLNGYIMNHLIYWWDHARKGDLFDKEKEKDKDEKTVVNAKAAQVDEVFNISKNVYTYDDSRAVCSALGARLATYDEVEQSYNDGGEWCNYGWSENQMILYPTQKATWNKLQKIDGHKNDCGRPGVNGGYIENPNVTFGVNCFGKKPAATTDDLTRLKASAVAADASAAAVTDPIEQAKIAYWKQHANTFLQLNSFNRAAWSENASTAATATTAATTAK
jgi:hypothetical protein